MSKQHQNWAIAIFTTGLLIWGHALAQTPSPTPQITPSPTPTLTRQQQETIERMVDERFEKSSRVNDRIQSTVNQNFGWAIGLLTALIASLGIMPIIIVVLVWLLRGSVIQQIVSETQKQIEKDIEQEVKAQLEFAVAQELSKQIQGFKQDLESLKSDFIHQLQNLSLSAQTEKDRIFHELSSITPSLIQTEFVSPEVQKKIQDLTQQLEALKGESLQLTLSAEDYVKQGDALYFEGRYSEAIESLDKAIALNPSLIAAWISKGKTLRKAKRYDEALNANQAAIRLDPQNYWSWFGQGYTLNDLKRYEEALAAFDQTIKLNPEIHNSWNHRGYVLTKLHRYEEAFASLEKALAIDPTSSSSHYSKAYWYITQGQTDLAMANLKKAIELGPRHREWVKSDADFDPIRADDRFQQLMQSISPEKTPLS